MWKRDRARTTRVRVEPKKGCGPFSVHAKGGYEYFISFIDDYSRYGYVHLMKKKI